MITSSIVTFLARKLPSCCLVFSSFTLSASAASFSWNSSAEDELWSNELNWLSSPGSGGPNGAGDEVIFDSISSFSSIDLDLDRTIGSLSFDSSNNYTLFNNTLTLDASSGYATISVNNSNGNGAHTISSNLNLADNLWITNNSTANFTLSGITSGGYGLTKAGTGEVTLSGANTYSGATTISEGQLTIAAGNTGALANSAVTIDSGATLHLDDTGSGSFEIGSLSGDGTLDLGDSAADIGADNSSTTFSGSLIGADFDVIEKLGTGTWTLNGSGHDITDLELFNGTLLLDGASGEFHTIKMLSNDAQLTVQNATSSLSLSKLLNNQGAVLVTGSSTQIEIGVLSIGGGLQIEDGASLTTTTGFNQSSGKKTTVDQAHLSIETFDGGTTGTIAISDSGTGPALTVGSSSNSAFEGIIEDHTSGAGSVLKTGSGIITFSGANSYSGATTVSEGQLTIAAGNTGALANSAVTINSGATLHLDDTGSGSFEIGSLSGDGTLDLGDIAADIGGDNSSTTFSGSLIGADFDVIEKLGTGTWTLNGSGHDITDLELFNGTLLLDGASGEFHTIKMLSNDAQLTVQNATSSLSLSKLLNNQGAVLVTGSSTQIEIGVLSIGGGLQIEDGASLTTTTGFNQSSGKKTTVDQAHLSIETFDGGTTGTIAISDSGTGPALTVGSSSDSAFEGIIEDHTSGAGSVLKTGSGTITLSGANTYTGGSTIEEGTLALNNASAAGTGNINIDGGSLDLGGFTVSNEVNFGANGGMITGTGSISTALNLDNLNQTISPGNSPGILTFTVNQEWQSFTFEWELNDWLGSVAGTDFDQIQIDGSLSLTGMGLDSYELDIASLMLYNTTGDPENFDGTDQSWVMLTTTSGISGFDASYWNLDTSDFSPDFEGDFALIQEGNNLVLTYSNSIPEPSSVILMLLGATSLLVLRKRK